MSTSVPRGKFREYRQRLDPTATRRAGKAGVLVVVGLNTTFIALDRMVYGEAFGVLLAIRLAWNVVMGGVWLGLNLREPMRAVLAGCGLTGLGMLLVIAAAGGATGDYWPGMMILLLGMPVLLPLSALQAGVVSAGLVAGFALLPLVGEETFSWRAFGISLCFVGASGIECICSSALLDRLRFRDFLQKQELERARDELAELDQAKSRFTANVHHELRTPLTLMLAPLEQVRSRASELPSWVGETLGTMHRNGMRLLKLINDLLDLSRVESGQKTVSRARLDLAGLCGEVVAAASALAERKGVVLELALAEAPPAVFADRDALEKVVVNLVGNALKFTDRGGRVTVSLAEVEEGEAVRVSVEDTGIGIPAEKLASIFDRFAQVDAGATRRYEGTGIGLSLARELVELHGGRIWAESEGRGHGSRLTFVVPRGEADADADEEVLRTADGRVLGLSGAFAAVETELGNGLSDVARQTERESEQAAAVAAFAAGGAGAAGAGTEGAEQAATAGRWTADAGPGAPRVLIAEDNPEMRRLLVGLLRGEYAVAAAPNGRAAWERLQEDPPHLVLTDVMMPEMSGTELCAAVKGEPSLSGIPVVLVTSKAEREMKIEGLEGGADDYVTKPFHPRELLARVRSLVRLRGLQEELAARNAELERALEELRQAEVRIIQGQRLAAVGELAAGVAHEVNNPVNFALNAVRALREQVEALREVAEQTARLDWEMPEKLAYQVEELQDLVARAGGEELPSTLQELTTIVAEGLERTARLVGDLRDFAAPGRRQHAPVDVRRGLLSTVQLVRKQLAEKGAELVVRVPEALPPVEGDPGALNQVFLNLLKNAAEALPEGGGRIVLEASAEAEGLRVRVADSGPGVPEAARERLFEPFFTTKEAGLGTGLGLSISRQIAEAHGGALELLPAEGEGATFALWLPREGHAGQAAGGVDVHAEAETAHAT